VNTIYDPVFLILSGAAEKRARQQNHNLAWCEAKLLSFTRGRVSLVRVGPRNGRTEVAAFAGGEPLFAKGVAS
jgi:hypothetical protein